MNVPESSVHPRPNRIGAARLLESAGLPASDLTDAHMEHFFYSGSALAPQAMVGVEFCGPDALLRSLVVAPELRAAGLGSELVRHAENYARARGARTIYLLTTTAEQFFSSRGYVAAARDTAPAAIRATREFAGLCPASSAFMFKSLERTYSVLFLCTGNSARSILAEALLNLWGRGKFSGFSAGSFPKGQVHPMALELLRRMNLPTEDLRSKSWDEFAAAGAPSFDFIFTVCDNAAGEICPVWPGKPMTAHWGIADPAAAEGSDAQRMDAFCRALEALEQRIKRFVDLPLDSLDGVELQLQLNAIGNDQLDGTAG